MILNRSHFLFAIVVVTIAMVTASCVEIPDKAPDPPATNASFHFISVTGSGTTYPPKISIADGPNFTNYKSYAIPSGIGADASPYYDFLSGSKRIIYSDTDTLPEFRLTLDTDQRGTIAFYVNKKGEYDAMKMWLRYTFAPNGLVDTTVVRFTNLVRRAQDTMDVYRSDSSLTSTSPVSANNVLFAATSAVVKIPAGKKYNFFFTDPSSQNRIFKDSITITGASRKVYTVFVYDQYDSSQVGVNKYINVRTKVLEEL